MYSIIESMNTWLLGKPDLWGWHTELLLCQWAVQIFPVGSCFEIFESLLTIEKSKYWYTFMVCKKYWLTMNIPSQLCTDAVWFFNLSVLFMSDFVRVGMIRMSLAHMKVFWSGNTLRWTLLISTLRLSMYFTLNSEINLVHVVLTHPMVVTGGSW